METSIKLLIDDGSKKGKLRFYAEKRDTKPSWVGMAGPLTFFCICLALLGIPLGMGFVLVFGYYFLYKRGVEIEIRELAEFKKTHTVNGLKARQVYGNDPFDFRFIIIALGFLFSYYLHFNLHLTDAQLSVIFPAIMGFLLIVNIYVKRLRMNYT